MYQVNKSNKLHKINSNFGEINRMDNEPGVFLKFFCNVKNVILSHRSGRTRSKLVEQITSLQQQFLKKKEIELF